MKNNFYFGILAGTVALALSVLLIKKTHLLDRLFNTENMTGDLEDFDSVIPKGEEKNVKTEFR